MSDVSRIKISNEVDATSKPGRYQRWVPRDFSIARLLPIAIALLATVAFYIEALPSGSLDAGFIFTGDYWHQSLPEIIKLHAYFSQGVFTGIDFSTHDGASEFFLRPNLGPYHPFLLFAFLFHRFVALESFIRLSVWMLVLHSFVGCYYAIRLTMRLLKCDIVLAAFVGVGYAFSIYMVNACFLPPFVFVATMLPCAIYGGLQVASSPSLKSAVLYSIPVFVMLTGGYVAVAIGTTFFAVVFTAAYLFYIDPQPFRGRAFVAALTPYAIAFGVVVPYYWEMFRYHALVPTAVQSLDLVAHQMAEMPHTVLRLLSGYPDLPGPYYEFTVEWGIICLCIIGLFLFGMRATDELADPDWRFLKVCGVIYLLVCLSIYGNYSAASDLLFFVPLIGKMHIYQRYLLPTHLFFMFAVAIMLRTLLKREHKRGTKILAASLAGLVALFSQMLGAAGWQQFAAEKLHLSEYFIFELLLGLLFTVSLLVPGKWFAVGVATFLMFLVPLNKMFDYTRSHPLSIERDKHLEMQREVSDRLLSYFRSRSRKPIIKYLDLTPDVREYFSKNYPWFVAERVPLSSYGGYDWHVGTQKTYMDRMQIIAPAGQNQLIMRPDWNWVARTGAEFVVYQEGHPLNDSGLKQFAETSDPSKVLHLPNGILVAPLRFGAESASGERVVFDNGYLRAAIPAPPLGEDLALGKKAEQSSLFQPDAGAEKAVDGRTDGVLANGSVTHTKQEANPWWQVDLGARATLNAITVWNRTDCCTDRLREFSIFISETPFDPKDTVAILTGRAGIWSSRVVAVPVPSTTVHTGGVRGRYVRVQLEGSNFLSLAEIQAIGHWGAEPSTTPLASLSRGPEIKATSKGFHTNGGSEIVLDLDTTGPVKLQYLFWPNERLRFHRNREVVASVVENGLQTIDLPAGSHHIEIRYVNTGLRVFLASYLLYVLGVTVTLLLAAVFRIRPLWGDAPAGLRLSAKA